MKTKKILFKVENLTKKFGSFIALNNINLTIYEGESVALIGANGAGKTTLSEIISGGLKQTSGTIKYEFGNTKAQIAKNIGIQFQDNTFPNGISVKDLIGFYVSVYKVDAKSKDFIKLLEVFELKHLMKKSANSLSGGQRQRLNVILAFLHKPKLLLLDEVSTGLDIKSRNMIRNYIKIITKANNSNLFLVSHNMDEVEFLCNRVILLENGSIIEDNKVSDIVKQNNSVENYANNYFNQKPKIKNLIRKELKN